MDVYFTTQREEEDGGGGRETLKVSLYARVYIDKERAREGGRERNRARERE